MGSIDLEIQLAGNVAWHIRTNGMDRVTPENIQLLCRVMERLAEREKLVQALMSEIDSLPMRTYGSAAMSNVVLAVDDIRSMDRRHTKKT